MNQIVDLLTEAAAVEFESTARYLDELRSRLGKEGTSLEEWNALVGASSYLKIEAGRKRDKLERKDDAV